MPDTQTNWDNWVAVLSAMEASLTDADATTDWDDELDAAAPVWVIPDEIGPLPAELRDHAARVLQAQDETIRRLEGHREVTGRHLAALRSIPSGLQGGHSAYLDVTG
ncbi:hypothetical protein [Glaciihabitans sp. UYNi722]|uniref:hypothetical protein n=1 Tax=Glaciihabitans sp. UYNi722 TaxID=3156344 RepID=UPI003390FC2D